MNSHKRNHANLLMKVHVLLTITLSTQVSFKWTCWTTSGNANSWVFTPFNKVSNKTNIRKKKM